jgi:hypothetical protein
VSAATLFLALLLLGLLSGTLDVAMNAQGVAIERHHARPLLAGLHGLWSIGLGAGAGSATLAAAVGASPLVQFAVVGGGLAVVSLALMRGLLPRSLEVVRPAGTGDAGWSPALIALGAIAFCLGPVTPIAFSAAGALAPAATGRNLGRVATVGYAGSVSGPIVIGWLAQATSLRLALGVTVALALSIAIAARAVQPRRPL